MTPGNAAPEKSASLTNDYSDDCVAKGLVAASIRAAMANAAQILNGGTASVSFELRYRVQLPMLDFG